MRIFVIRQLLVVCMIIMGMIAFLAVAQPDRAHATSSAQSLQSELDSNPDRRQAITEQAHELGLDVIEVRTGPQSQEKQRALVTGGGAVFTDCALPTPCPDMVVIPSSPANFKIGSPEDEPKRLTSEAQQSVAIKAFAMGRHEVRVSEYLACVTAGACRHPEWLEPGGQHNIETGSGVTYKSLGSKISGADQPIVGISWEDASAYATWLKTLTGRQYRLPSEAEWEFATRAGTTTAYWWGHEPTRDGSTMACCRTCGSDEDGKGFLPVTALQANAWGLHNVHGNVWEWVADYYCESYASGPKDGTARVDAKCGAPQSSPEGLRIFRGGSCFFEPQQMRAAMRLRNWPTFRNQTVGFRVARDLLP